LRVCREKLDLLLDPLRETHIVGIGTGNELGAGRLQAGIGCRNNSTVRDRDGSNPRITPRKRFEDLQCVIAEPSSTMMSSKSENV
jgi:hypothetical protein